MTPLVPIAGSVVLNAFAQISLRHSSTERAASNNSSKVWLAIWAVSFCVATLLWLMAIREADISYAYPLLGAGYVLVTLLAKWLLKERISPMRWVSILVISAGVLIVGVNR